MSKEPTKKERIIDLCGIFPPEEIAQIIGGDIDYVNKVIKGHKANLRPSLTLQNYAAAHRQGIKRKCDLARYFGVSRMTINRFENKPEIKSYFEKYIKFRKSVYLENLALELSGIMEMLEMFEPKTKTTKNIKALIDLIKKFDKKAN